MKNYIIHEIELGGVELVFIYDKEKTLSSIIIDGQTISYKAEKEFIGKYYNNIYIYSESKINGKELLEYIEVHLIRWLIENGFIESGLLTKRILKHKQITPNKSKTIKYLQDGQLDFEGNEYYGGQTRFI